MARISGVDLPRGKRIEIALTYIYGIGRSSSQKILTEAGLDWDAKSDQLTEKQIAWIRKIIDDKYKVDIESVYKYPIPKGFRKTIKKELAQLGINHQTLFPDDLDKLTESLLWSQFELPNIK